MKHLTEKDLAVGFEEIERFEFGKRFVLKHVRDTVANIDLYMLVDTEKRTFNVTEDQYVTWKALLSEVGAI